MTIRSRILYSTENTAIARNATPVHQKLKVRKTTMPAARATGTGIQITLTTNRTIAIPTITRAGNRGVR